MNSFSCDPRASFAERRLGARPVARPVARPAARPAATMVVARLVKGDVMI